MMRENVLNILILVNQKASRPKAWTFLWSVFLPNPLVLYEVVFLLLTTIAVFRSNYYFLTGNFSLDRTPFGLLHYLTDNRIYFYSGHHY